MFAKLDHCNQLVPQGGGTSAGFPLHGLLLDLWPPLSWISLVEAYKYMVFL